MTGATSLPLVSIGVPVFNGAKTLRQALDSILLQTYQNIEVVICDNASTDETGDICREYGSRDNRIRYHRNPTNIGANPNFWRTVEVSNGEFFMWGAVDDLKPPLAVESCVQALLRNPQAVLAYGNVYLKGPGWKQEVEVKNPMPMTGLSPSERVKVFVRELRTNTIEYGLYRREALVKGVYGNSFGVDTLFLLQMCMLGPFAYTHTPLLIYQERGEQPNDIMYHEVPLSLKNLLTVGPHIRRKCWTVLLRGAWYLGKLEGPSGHDKLSAIRVYVQTYIARYHRRLAKEIVFQAVNPFAKGLFWLWDLSKRSPVAARITRHVHRVVMKV